MLLLSLSSTPQSLFYVICVSARGGFMLVMLPPIKLSVTLLIHGIAPISQTNGSPCLLSFIMLSP